MGPASKLTRSSQGSGAPADPVLISRLPDWTCAVLFTSLLLSMGFCAARSGTMPGLTQLGWTPSMTTVFTHAAAAMLLSRAFPESSLPRRAWLIGSICAVLPDADVAGMWWLDIPYGDLLGHRGLSHSLFFALIVAITFTWGPRILFRRSSSLTTPRLFALYLFLCTASHGLFDALTNGGRGIAFFSPFDEGRYFLPWTPVAVAPIGVRAMFSEWGLQVMLSELTWVWAPLALVAALWSALRRLLGRA